MDMAELDRQLRAGPAPDAGTPRSAMALAADAIPAGED
jgi:hypothetical protein